MNSFFDLMDENQKKDWGAVCRFIDRSSELVCLEIIKEIIACKGELLCDGKIVWVFSLGDFNLILKNGEKL